MPTTQNPTFLAVETHDGRATLGGRRRLLDNFDDAVESAEEMDGQVFAIEAVESAPFEPVLSITHVRIKGEPFASFPTAVA